MSSAYIYAIVGADHDHGAVGPGLEDAPVRRVTHGPVAALVSAVEGELLGRRRELLRHADVLEAALAEGPVLPLRFGTVMDDEEAVITELLEPRAGELEALLDEVRGRVEVRVRGFYDEDAILAEVVAERPVLRNTGAGLEARIQAGEQVSRALAAKRRSDGDAIVERLRPLALEVERNEPQTPMMVVNAAFLLLREGLESFGDAVNDLAGDLGDRIHLKYIGPLPPASFVDLTLDG